MTATMTWVGLDVHARSTHAAAIDRDSGELTRARFGVGADPVVEWLRGLPRPVHACCEAGLTGYALYRAAVAAGLHVDVVAPSKTPRAAADRIKTDRKEAELLVRLLLSGSLVSVAVPSAESEAARDLARVREQVRADLAPAAPPRLQAAAALRARGRGRRQLDAGTPPLARRTALRAGRDRARLPRRAGCDRRPARPPGRTRRATVAACDRAAALADRRQAALLPRHRDALRARARSRGRDFARFQRPAQLAAWLGLVPSLHQSGESETRGSITKTGSGFARRILVEAAWHYLREPRIGATLRDRHAGQPDHILQIAWRAQHRLHRLHQRLRGRGKPGNVAVVAVARELACFLWAAAVAD